MSAFNNELGCMNDQKEVQTKCFRNRAATETRIRAVVLVPQEAERPEGSVSRDQGLFVSMW